MLVLEKRRGVRMGWSEKLMESLDRGAEVLDTDRGPVQFAREGQGPPVLVVHGGPGGYDQGLGLGRHFVDAGCEVLAPSRPGYLRTPLESGRSPEEQADLYAALLTALQIDQVAVLGVSSGGPSAVHFAARHPEMTSALMLDVAVLRPFPVATSRINEMLFGSSLGVRLVCQLATKRPQAMAAIIVDSFSAGYDKQQKKDATEWIRSNPTRLRQAGELATSLAPREFRAPGQANDEATEPELPPRPFDKVTAPTLIATGTNDGIVPVEHSTNAANQIEGAEIMLIDGAHHGLSLSRNYAPLARRQIELTLGA
jgi:pimeloyl-ACP methyl ester carboxylesterase